VIKCRRALRQSDCRTLVIAGGVSANRRLRQRMQRMVETEGGEIFFPRPEHCTDNGAMIAYAGALRLQAGQTQPLGFGATARWHLESLPRLDSVSV